MPNYDYLCSKCHHQFEEFLSIEKRDIPLAEICPACGIAGGVSRLMAAPAIAVSDKKVRFSRIPTCTKGPGMIVGASRRPSATFRDRLKDIKKTHRGSNINTH